MICQSIVLPSMVDLTVEEIQGQIMIPYGVLAVVLHILPLQNKVMVSLPTTKMTMKIFLLLQVAAAVVVLPKVLLLMQVVQVVVYPVEIVQEFQEHAKTIHMDLVKVELKLLEALPQHHM